MIRRALNTVALFLHLASIGYSRTEVVEEAEDSDPFSKWRAHAGSA